MNKKIVATRSFPLATDWLARLKTFSDLAGKNHYHRLDYHLWKNISKPTIKGIVVNLIAQTDNYPAVVEIVNDAIFTKLDSTDCSFGEFLFNNIFNEEERDKAYMEKLTTLSSSSTSLNSSGTSYYDIVDNIAGTSASAIYTNKIGISDYSIANNISDYIREDVKKIVEEEIKNNNNEEKKEMKGFNFDFGPCTGDQVRMSMYGLAVKNAAGTYVSYNPKSKEIVDVDILNFDGAKFMYKIPVAIKEIAVGDIIIHNRKPLFVTALPTEGATTITCIDVCAGEQKLVIPTVSPFGFNFITKVVSLFNGVTMADSENPFGNMLPFMLMSDDDKINPMMMMLMMGGKMDFSNPMMIYFMMKDNKDSDMLPLLFMMQNK